MVASMSYSPLVSASTSVSRERLSLFRLVLGILSPSETAFSNRYVSLNCAHLIVILYLMSQLHFQLLCLPASNVLSQISSWWLDLFPQSTAFPSEGVANEILPSFCYDCFSSFLSDSGGKFLAYNCVLGNLIFLLCSLCGMITLDMSSPLLFSTMVQA